MKESALFIVFVSVIYPYILIFVGTDSYPRSKFTSVLD
jgi:hypothetical protein